MLTLFVHEPYRSWVIVVGLTGGIGSGKSTVASLLAARGAWVIDADAVARRLAEPGGASYAALAAHFGPEVVNPDGTLNRKAIAARVFTDPDELAVLNAITHPAIAADIEAQLATLAGTGPVGATAGRGPASEGPAVVVLDLPLLDLAARMRYRLAAVVVVDVPLDVARRRLIEQRGIGEADADARIAAQITREVRRGLADVVIDNSGTPEALEASVDDLWSWLQRL
ncbi:MAG: dephospho-CoA kinase [Acidimicrobiales bacterium]